MDLLVRFVLGGIVVSAFALLGDLFKPKSFAGLFAGAPTIALATMSLTFHKHGASYLATNARSMAAGALAFAIFSLFYQQNNRQSAWKTNLDPLCYCQSMEADAVSVTTLS